MAADLVIRNGTVVDGTGAPPVRGDVAVTGDTITAVGEVDERGAREVDAEGVPDENISSGHDAPSDEGGAA